MVVKKHFEAIVLQQGKKSLRDTQNTNIRFLMFFFLLSSFECKLFLDMRSTTNIFHFSVPRDFLCNLFSEFRFNLIQFFCLINLLFEIPHEKCSASVQVEKERIRQKVLLSTKPASFLLLNCTCTFTIWFQAAPSEILLCSRNSTSSSQSLKSNFFSPFESADDDACLNIHNKNNTAVRMAF